MTTRILPRDEYPRLMGTEAETVWPHLPETAKVLVVERDAAIVGCWVLLPIYHVECLWIDPAHRKGLGAARRLWVGMRKLAASLGVSRVQTGAMTEDVRGLLAHLQAVELPGTHYVMEL